MKRIPMVALVVGIAASVLVADEAPKSALPSTKEAAQGWIALFDGESTFGWTVEGDVKVEKGLLVLGPKRATMRSNTQFLDFQFRVDVEGEGVARIGEEHWEFDGKTPYYSFTTTRKNFKQPAGLILESVPGKTFTLHKVWVHPFHLKPLFNMSDLTGWKEHPGKKSKFSATKEGWLNVKDGPGDLQTTGLYDDFVLQLECISNGKHLNSGIFFRALPGEYQQGYEAQIRNQFNDKPDQKYTVEDYDPKSHKLLGKRTVLSPAVDYGTGAIYRRVPARSAVAKDGEWFTMTVVAQGRHLATWVNGVQQADWTDNRPDGENARKGYYGRKGAISIQGHDPTTDLSFRHLQVTPLPRE
jgi:Domain of Unknown Function (DUF1080)